MKKQILNLGKALNKLEQKTINGGIRGTGCIERIVCDPLSVYYINTCLPYLHPCP